jgi:threonine dehydrogenase-like Zn-dependent dehydrogenase
MGMGILGLAALQLLRAAGAAPIIAVDPVAEKREKALQCGADYALDPYKSDFIETVKQLTDGGAKVAIAVTGVGKALDSVLDCMARYGRVALLGCTRNSDFTIDYYHKVHGPGITLVGAHASARPQTESSNGWWTQRDDIHTLMKLTEMGRLSLASMIDEVHSPMEAVEVYDRLANEKAFPLVQFDWRKMS